MRERAKDSWGVCEKREGERVTVHKRVYHLNLSHSYVEATCKPRFAISYYGVKAGRLYYVTIGCNLVTRYFYPFFEIHKYEFTFLSQPNLRIALE